MNEANASLLHHSSLHTPGTMVPELVYMTIDHRPSAPATGDAAVLDALQERMDRIIRGDSPNAGQFCGYCYARLEEGQQRCAICGRLADEVQSVSRVPRDALRVYNAHRKKMRLWVNLFAYLGILFAVALFIAMIVYLPNPWVWFAIPVLFFGSWYLANLLGGWLGALLGTRAGIPARAALWQQLLERRAAGEDLDT
jgi:hypothetical protein